MELDWEGFLSPFQRFLSSASWSRIHITFGRKSNWLITVSAPIVKNTGQWECISTIFWPEDNTDNYFMLGWKNRSFLFVGLQWAPKHLDRVHSKIQWMPIGFIFIRSYNTLLQYTIHIRTPKPTIHRCFCAYIQMLFKANFENILDLHSRHQSRSPLRGHVTVGGSGRWAVSGHWGVRCDRSRGVSS